MVNNLTVQVTIFTTLQIAAVSSHFFCFTLPHCMFNFILRKK